MRLYGETAINLGLILDPYCLSAKIMEDSELDYTITHLAWFTDDEINYRLTYKGEAFQGNRVSRLHCGFN